MTLVEVLMVIGIVVCLGVMLLPPAILGSREAARQTQCSHNLRAVGMACLNYAQANQVFMPSSDVTRDAKGKIVAVDGWSWAVLVLPYMEGSPQQGKPIDFNRLYDSLDIQRGRPLIEPAGAKGTPHADALATSLPGLLCPSSDAGPYVGADGKWAAVTSYHPFGATHIESLSVASAGPLKPKYGLSTNLEGGSPVEHPDGACFPGTNMTFPQVRKGLSNTLFFGESLEPRFARWTVGAEAAFVGLPREVEFEVGGDGYVPKGHAKALANSPEADFTYWSYHTYLDWDYDRSPYDGADGTLGGKYGPGSNHTGGANHLIMDGSVKFIRSDIDVAVYMYLIKRVDR
jgi:type II secretory pathway pseudopilin PulG